FNSGLLSNGSTWQLIPGATGTFPYYCIPHGAPGGVGMAGIINVTSSCSGSTANGTMVVAYTNTSGQGFVVLDNGTPITGSPFASGSNGTLTIPLAITGDGTVHTFTVSDAANNSCSATQVATVPMCNTSSCVLNLTQVSVSACMGNTVTLNVAFTSNQSLAAFNVYKDGLKLNPLSLTTAANGSGTYSTLIVGNGITSNIIVQFVENTSCSASQSVVIPSCAGPCLISSFVVGQGGSIHTVEVKDFAFEPATIDVLIGDTVHFVWTGAIPHTTTSDQFSGLNSWNSGLLGQGSTYDLVIGETGSFPYYCQPHGGPGGIGMSGVINVIDTCDQEHWLTNMSFSVSAGSPLGYNVFVDGVKITDTPIQYDDPVGLNSEIIQLPGDGAWHLVTIQDLETGFCAYTTPVFTSICGAGCSVIDLTVTTGTNIIHTVEVRDFNYFPGEIVVGAGEIIRFVWTGEIPHTVTSDAVSGPEVWNSGLLGEGATYDLIINTPGVHPYFCLPHGGPGGIGMSDVITVLPACADNNQNVKINFDITNGSLLGYNLFVDGVPYGSNPRQYDDRKGANQVSIAYPADNNTHILTIQDLDNSICAASDFFTMGTCNASCELNDIDYFLGNGRKYDVLVRDFDYDPSTINVEVGDTIHFVWTGSIPHTVTSDVAAGPQAFNSGLLGNGATYDLVVTAPGEHPYYCIPHGAPGGIGMAGNIIAIDACDDGNVFVDFRFFSEGTGTSYNVTNQGTTVLNDQLYQIGGIQHFALQLPAQGQSHLIQVSDNGPDDCTITVSLDSFDCSDPCFLVRSDFEYDIDFGNLEVTFTDHSKGNIIAWSWNFGDGITSTLKNPTHNYSEAVLRQVCLTVTDVSGCTETYCDKISLGADVCQAGFTYQQNGLEFVFYNISDVSNSAVGATWTFGDGNSSTKIDSVMHTYALGIYEICVTVTATGCVNTYCEILDLRDSCLALRADYISTNVSGNPLHYQFTDQSGGPIGSRLWGFGDGQISTSDNPDHNYDQIGVYTVCLLVLGNAGNCTDSDCRTLYVGTTSSGPVEVQMKKITVVPNPVSIAMPEVNISGFDVNDTGHEAHVIVLDMSGRKIMEQEVLLQQNHDIKLPSTAGVYYLQVVTAKNRYGAMIAIQ
ncbi:MAG: PKD domain-containing protein, partial [Bacteroidota bacterium]|nr:PKD domain-containing protein [Bacteroidota bacterium]